MKTYELTATVASRVEKAFQQHPVTQEQQQRFEEINQKLSSVARRLCQLTPESPEQTRMINALKDAEYLALEAIRKNEA